MSAVLGLPLVLLLLLLMLLLLIRVNLVQDLSGPEQAVLPDLLDGSGEVEALMHGDADLGPHIQISFHHDLQWWFWG